MSKVEEEHRKQLSDLEDEYHKHLVACAEVRGHVNAVLGSTGKNQETAWKAIRKLDERIRAVEIKSAVYGFLAGIGSATIVYIITRLISKG